MTIVMFPPDTRRYEKYSKNHRTYIRCLATREDEEENVIECNFRNIREDNMKTRKKPHTCVFEAKPIVNTITNYFKQKNPNDHPDSPDKYCIENLVTRVSMLVGRKNLPLSFSESEEFYDYTLYAMACGACLIDRSEGNYIEQAKKHFPHHKRTFYHDDLIKTARTIHKMTMKEFATLDYVCCAIDQGSVLGRKNVDFILESPFATMEPYPYCTMNIDDQTAEGYLPKLEKGLGDLESFGIRLGSVVADGNLAQKKCFDIRWDQSLRKPSAPHSLKAVIFIPCLCHRVDNALKYHIAHNETLKSIQWRIHEIAIECRDNRQAIGAICPNHVATRWVYDFEILEFLRKHSSKIQTHVRLPEEIHLLHPVMYIFKRLIQHFESSRTYHFKALVHLERAINALGELDFEHRNPYALGFQKSLIKYTLESKDAGVWILSNLLTRKGHNQFNQRLRGRVIQPKKKYLEYFTSHDHHDADPRDDISHDLIDEDKLGDEPNRDEGPEILIDDERDAQNILTEEEIHDHEFRSSLHSAKQFLNQQLALTFGTASVATIMNRFNAYLDEVNPFEKYQVDNAIGFSWKQIALSFRDYAPIADLALRLHNSVCSEASCERTIATQKLILTARRKTSKNQLLDARLTLMRSQIRN